MIRLKNVALIFGLIMASHALYGQQTMIVENPQAVNACNGDCYGTTWTQQTKSISVSRGNSARYAKPSATNTADVCDIKVQFKTRTCSGIPNDGPHTDIYFTSFCSTCFEDIEVILRKIILRSHLDDDPLNIMNGTAQVQYFRWIMPKCWSEFRCDDKRCAAACECAGQNLSINQTQSLTDFCQGCCSFSTRRVKKAGCDVVITFNGQDLISTASQPCSNTFPNFIPPAVTGLEVNCTTESPCESACFELTQDDFPVIPR